MNEKFIVMNEVIFYFLYYCFSSEINPRCIYSNFVEEFYVFNHVHIAQIKLFVSKEILLRQTKGCMSQMFYLFICNIIR